MDAASFFKSLPTLESERLILRGISADDLPGVFAYASIPEVSRYLPWAPHQSLDDTKIWLDSALESCEAGGVSPWAIVLKETGALIGTIEIRIPSEGVGAVGFVIGSAYWGRGLTPEALGLVLGAAFEHLGLARIEGVCDVENIASARVMEKAGMQFVRLLPNHMEIKGRVRDHRMYAVANRRQSDKEKGR